MQKVLPAHLAATCKHPRPDLCKKLGRHLHGHLLEAYLLRPDIRAKWDAEADARAHGPVPNSIPLGFRHLPCVHEGPVITWCHGRNGDARHVRDCEVHGQCSRGYRDDTVKACSLCTDYVPGNVRMEWISTARLVRDTIAFAGKLPPDLAGIGGVVRSGMIPAAILATLLHLPLWEIAETREPRQLAAGGRGPGGRPGGKLFIVDDTVSHGTAMGRVRNHFQLFQKATKLEPIFGAIYVSRGNTGKVDLVAQEVDYYHFLEWNWANSGSSFPLATADGQRVGIATDLDGILCHDDESGGTPGEPFMVHRKSPIPLIVTGRPESTRPGTEAWLTAQGIQFKRLEMLPNSVPLTAENAAVHKAEHFDKSTCTAFIESCPVQAKMIHELTGRPVICPRVESVFQKR